MSTTLSTCLVIASLCICQSLEIKAGGNDASLLFISPTGMVRADEQPEEAGEHSEPPKDIISEPSLGHSPASHAPLSKPERKVSAGHNKLPEDAQLRKEALSGHQVSVGKSKLPEDAQLPKEALSEAVLLQKVEVKLEHSNPFWNPVWDEASGAKPSLFGRRNQVMAGFVFIITLNIGLIAAGIVACIMVKKRVAKTLGVPGSRAADASAAADAEAGAKAAADNDGDAASSFAPSSRPSLSQSAFTGAGGSPSAFGPPVLDPDNCAGCGTDYAPNAANCRKCGIPRMEEYGY